MQTRSVQRFALYYAPQPETVLAEAAAAWLGRDQANLNRTRITPIHLSLQRFCELTREPYHYGFHGTLKPPFRLVENRSEKQLVDELRLFCAQRKSFMLPELAVDLIGDFLCLRPTKPSMALNGLARDTVQQFDHFRKEMPPAERGKRRSKGLTPQQDELLLQYGYPYVLDQFRFHITLTSTVENQEDRRLIEEEARHHFSPQLLREIQIAGIALFTECDGQAMTQREFFPFGS